MADGVARLLVDSLGNIINVFADGADYLLGVSAKLRNVAGTYINPATEDTLSSVDTNLTSVVDAGNSTTTQLGQGESFIGTGVDCVGYATVAITVHSDKDSQEDGMTFQFSMDNTNWDDTYSWWLRTREGTTRRFQFPVTARYFRVNYTTRLPTSEFRVQTILHRQNILTSIHRLEDDVSRDRSAQIVKSALIAQRRGARNQDFIPVAADLLGNLKVNVGAEQTTSALLSEIRDSLKAIHMILESMGD